MIFFGTFNSSANAATPIQVLSLATAALGFKISHKKMSWAMTRLEILGIKLDFMAQTASITSEHQQCILQSCSQVLHQGRASLLELQQIAGHLQFVMHIAPHGHAFLHWLYNAVRAHYKAPFGCCISKPTRDELSWWISTLQSWDSISLLQPSPLLVAHIWTDTSKHCIGAHLGTMDNPEAVFSHELARRHHHKDIHFLKALAVLEVLQCFSPLWTSPRCVVVHVNNKNVEYGLKKGSIRNAQTQVLFQVIFSLCLQHHINLILV